MADDASGYGFNPEEVPKGFLSTKAEEISLVGYRCQGCGHEWRPRKEHPSVCPDCGASLIWDDGESEEADLDDLFEDDDGKQDDESADEEIEEESLDQLFQEQ